MKDYPCSYECHHIGCHKTCQKYKEVRDANYREALDAARKANRIKDAKISQKDAELIEKIHAGEL